MGDHWRVSALVTQIKNPEQQLFEELLANWKPKTYKIPKSKPLKSKDPVCAVMSLQDIHFGKQGNDTIDKDFEDTIINLMSRAAPVNYIEKMYFVIGGDLRAKDGLILDPLLKEEVDFDLPKLGLKDPPLFGNLPVCFSMTTAFLL